LTAVMRFVTNEGGFSGERTKYLLDIC
jgi:hypothetical protein